jgi:Acetyl-coenzyme A transporter 1
MNVGYFTSFTLFLALNDADFSNRYLRPTDALPLDHGVLSLATYFRFWAAVYAAATAAVWAFRERGGRARAPAALCASLATFLPAIVRATASHFCS